MLTELPQIRQEVYRLIDPRARRVKVGALTPRLKRQFDRADAAAYWLLLAEQYFIEHHERVMRERRRVADDQHRAWHKARLARIARQRSFEASEQADFRADDPLGDPLPSLYEPRTGHKPLTTCYHPAGQHGPSLIRLGLTKCVVKSAETNDIVRITTFDRTTQREKRWGAADSIEYRNPDNRAQAWDDYAPLPSWEPHADAENPVLTPEEDVVNFAELHGKVVVTLATTNDPVFDHERDAVCETCQRGPALCTCHAGFRANGEESDIVGEDDEYDGFSFDDADWLIAREGDLVAVGLDTSLAHESADWSARVLKAREARRAGQPGSTHEAARLKSIRLAAIAVARAEADLRRLAKDAERLNAIIEQRLEA
jgi:hypothetical protein